ncbi:MAG: SurA N-terminal domain-containing protein [Atribacterota bacterium]|nr:SurA N-terminal domain-containing protein [Atribacterota bacterium]MDD5636365.1 SurA N-terminal domain-containing protein [Atribacterota bacterium]
MQFIRKNIKPILLAIVIVFVVSIFYGLGQYRSSGSRSQQVGNMIAEVNGIGISYQQWQNTFMNFISRYDNQTLSSISDEVLASLKNNITEQLVNSTLIYQYAEKQNISIPDSDVNNEIEQIKSSFNSDQEFNNALSKNNLTLNQLKDNLNRQLMINKVVQNEYDKIAISEEEITQYYEENKSYFFQSEKRKISHILVEDKEEAELLLSQLSDGVIEFEKTAKDKSICPSAEQGGDLGYVVRGQMVPAFEEAAFSLEIGELSNIVETEYGYHIIQCNDIQEEKQLTLEEAKENIKNVFTYQKQNEVIEALLAQLREEANIIIHYDFTSELEAKEQDKDGNQITETEISTEENQLSEGDVSEEGIIEEIIEN